MKITGNHVKSGDELYHFTHLGNGEFTAESTHITSTRGAVRARTNSGKIIKISRRELKSGRWGK